MSKRRPATPSDQPARKVASGVAAPARGSSGTFHRDLVGELRAPIVRIGLAKSASLSFLPCGAVISCGLRDRELAAGRRTLSETGSFSSN